MIKGGGVVYIREKIVDVLVEIFLVVVDSGKLVDKLGFIFLLLVEVIFMVLIFVMWVLVKLGGKLELCMGVKKVGFVVID